MPIQLPTITFKRFNMPSLNTWITSAHHSDFSIYNLPFGIFSTDKRSPRAGIAIGEEIIDLYRLAGLGLLEDLSVHASIVGQDTLNAFIGLGKKSTGAVRKRIQDWLCREGSPLQRHPEIWVKQAEAQMHLPVQIGDYTDFYSSLEHATNVGKMFRDPENALLPNWRHLPVAYHGRASSIIPSGRPVRRPQGQVMPTGGETPVFQPSGQLDFELEMGFIIGKNSELGRAIPVKKAADYIFGLVLFNDWSARDIQKWEYIPLGPFLGKNFASSISPWIVTLEALEAFKTKGPKQEPEVLPYLKSTGKKNYDIELSVSIQPKDGKEQLVCRSNTRYLYWNMAQQLAHHTVNGCNVRVGDLMASGTISGPEPDAYGSLLELSWGGSKKVKLGKGATRTFLEDHDTVILRGRAEKDGRRIGFGEVRTEILPAK